MMTLPHSLVGQEDGHIVQHGCFLLRVFGQCGKTWMMGFGACGGEVGSHRPLQRWHSCFVLSPRGCYLGEVGCRAETCPEIWPAGQREGSLNVKFGYCPGCHLHKFLGEWVLWCWSYHSFFPSVYLFLAFMSAHLITLLACHECPSLNTGKMIQTELSVSCDTYSGAEHD